MGGAISPGISIKNFYNLRTQKNDGTFGFRVVALKISAPLPPWAGAHSTGVGGLAQHQRIL